MSAQNEQRILNRIYKISEHYRKEKEKNGGDFNIFSILRKDNDEVNLHSKFIYELLNTDGSHHQNNLFLDLFVSEALDIENYDKSSLRVFREYLTEFNRRIDFLIESNNYIIGIEMKIDAKDQETQLVDYYKELKKLSNGRKIALFYLTKFGDEPSIKSKGSLEEGKDFFNKSFILDIDWWLDKCINKTSKIPKINISINQYKSLITKITGRISNTMEQEMNEIVKGVKDIEAMNTLVNQYPRIWAEKENDFWNELIIKLEKRVIFSNGKYKLKLYDEFDNERKVDSIVRVRHKNGVGVLGFIINKCFSCFSISIYISQQNANYLYLGIYFLGVKGGNKNDDKAITLLKESLNIEGRWTILNEEIIFFAKDVVEPCSLLFNEEKFKYYVKDITDKIVKVMTFIDKNEEKLSKLIK